MNTCGGIFISKLVLFIALFYSNLLCNDIFAQFTFVGKEISVFNEIPKIMLKEEQHEKAETVLATYHGPITAYGPDCTGCTTGYTASGYYVRNTIYYNDKQYGKIRILAADRSLPFGTIVRISDLNVFAEPVLAIVLDRGSAIGFNKKSYFDLLYKSEKETEFFGRRNATFEVLRRGY